MLLIMVSILVFPLPNSIPLENCDINSLLSPLIGAPKASSSFRVPPLIGPLFMGGFPRGMGSRPTWEFPSLLQFGDWLTFVQSRFIYCFSPMTLSRIFQQITKVHGKFSHNIFHYCQIYLWDCHSGYKVFYIPLKGQMGLF